MTAAGWAALALLAALLLATWYAHYNPTTKKDNR